MPNRLALILGVETHQDSTLPNAPYADSDAQAISHALVPLGYTDAIVLTGTHATRTAITSRLRKLAKGSAPAEAVVFYAGHTFDEDESYLACHDTQADDVVETSLPLQSLLAAFAKCGRVTFLLDLRSGREGIEPPGNGVCLLSCAEGEVSHLSGSLKSSIWAHHILEALSGRAPRALENGHLLTARALQAYLVEELPRTLRGTFREAPPQTPTLLPMAEGRGLIADLRQVLEQLHPTSDPRLQPLKRGTLRSETRMKVKALGGFRKFHHLPDKVNASARKFVADIAHEDVKQDVDQIYTALRESLGYKRRDVEGSSDRSSGFVRTPDFEYSVSIELADDDLSTVVVRREVAGIRAPEVILGKPFQKVFGGIFDTLVFEFTQPFDLETWVDRLEEELPKGVKVRTSSDCSFCDVHVKGNACMIRLYRDHVEIQGQKTPGSKGLVEGFLNFQDLFSRRKDLQALPLLEAKE